MDELVYVIELREYTNDDNKALCLRFDTIQEFTVALLNFLNNGDIVTTYVEPK